MFALLGVREVLDLAAAQGGEWVEGWRGGGVEGWRGGGGGEAGKWGDVFGLGGFRVWGAWSTHEQLVAFGSSLVGYLHCRGKAFSSACIVVIALYLMSIGKPTAYLHIFGPLQPPGLLDGALLEPPYFQPQGALGGFRG